MACGWCAPLRVQRAATQYPLRVQERPRTEDVHAHAELERGPASEAVHVRQHYGARGGVGIFIQPSQPGLGQGLGLEL